MHMSGPNATRWQRWLRRAAMAALLAYAAYLLLGNVFLNTPVAHSLVNRQPQKFHMQWARAYTLWPGRVALRDVRLGGQARRTQWSVQAGGVRGRVALLPLLAKQVHVPWVDADGVRGSVDRVDSALPPPHARSGGWTLRMDRIASDSIAGGDVFGWTLAGSGAAEIAFRKQFRGGPVELLPSSATFNGLTVSRDGEAWLRDARIASTFSLASHLSSDYPGLRKLELFAATLEMDGQAVALRYALGDDDRYRFDVIPGEGKVAARLSLARGALARGDSLQLTVPLHATDADGRDEHSSIAIGLAVEDDLRLRILLPDRGQRRMSMDADLRVPGTALPLQDWQARLRQASGHARGQVRVPSIGALLALFAQAEWLALEGSGDVEVDLQLQAGRLADGSRLQARDVVAVADVLGNRFRGQASAEARIEATPDGHARSRVNLVMSGFDAAPQDAPSRKYVSGNDLRLELVSDARIEHMRESLAARLRFDRARIPDLTVFNPYLPNDRLRFGGGSGVLTGDLQVDGDGDVGAGTLRVDGRRARLSVAGIDLRGDVVIDARLRRGNLQRGNFELGGSRVQVRNVAFIEAGAVSRSGWWATLDLDGGRVAWKRPPSAGGRLRARMRDVGFLLALFADRADYPAWIGRLVDAGEARVDGHWLWQGDALILDRVHAANDRFKVDARLRLQGDHRDGDLHASWGRLGAAVELRGGQRKLHLRNARQWYDARPDLLP